MTDRRQLRGTILVEDQRTQRVMQQVMKRLGVRRVDIKVAPSGKGSGESWVLRQYPAAVSALRSKNYQKGLFLIAVRDGDGDGLAYRKQQLDQALTDSGQVPRANDERICLPVPTWSIETWLLNLQGHPDLDETQKSAEGKKWKEVYEALHRQGERDALRQAADALCEGPSEGWLPSLRDGHEELGRLDR